MALPTAEQIKVASQLLRDNTQPLGAVTKGNVFDAVVATDTWIDVNYALWHATLPLAVQTGLTATQKSWIFAYVLMRRIGTLRVEEDG